MTNVLRSIGISALLVFHVTPVFAQPGAATLATPASDVVGSTVAFTWQSAVGATWYHFWLGRPNASLVMEQWYTAEHAGCAGGGTCTVTVTPAVTAGPYIWYIRTWSNAGYGPWSQSQGFSVRDVMQAWSGILPPSRRFTVVLNNLGVLDNETGLVWQRAPSGTGHQWRLGLHICAVAGTANRFGWRMPTLSELMSLIDATNSPLLPTGHPFTLPASPVFWTLTHATSDTNSYYAMNFQTGSLTSFPDHIDTQHRLWCVRGGSSSAQ